MKASTIDWHLSRDNQIALHKFCQSNCIKQHTGSVFSVDNKNYFYKIYQFDNDGYIKVELRAGDKRSYTIADHFQVVEYEAGQ